MSTATSRLGIALVLATLATLAAVAGCTGTGHVNVLGYTTEPNYDCGIRTVYVPIAKNYSYRRGLEFDITRAVVRDIEARTPFKVVSSCEAADTQLDMKVVNWTKAVINPSQINLVREAEVTLGVEVVWRDLRPGKNGEILSNPKRTTTDELPLPGMPPPPPAGPQPVLLLPVAAYQPELGGSNATADKQAVDRLATQVISMMEKGW